MSVPPEHLALYDRWQKAYEEVAPEIVPSTVAVLGNARGVTQQFGTGVLLKIADTHFLLSAAHVIDHATIHEIPCAITPGVPGQLPIPLVELNTGTTPTPVGRQPRDPEMRDDDPLDMGFVELTREMVGQMPAARFVSLSEIDVEPRLRMGCYLVYGYPNSFSGVNTKDRVVYTEPLRYLTELHDNPEDRFDPRWQVRLKYPPLGYTHSKGHVSMPSPKGMSRCGIWRIVDLKPAAMWRRDDVKLVAIDQMWHGQRRYIQGTRLPYLLFMIYRQYPSLRPAMDLRLGLVTRGW